ncbi:MAG: hypothetical protein ACI4CT_01315 [Lachnospiraceae bacterium]
MDNRSKVYCAIGIVIAVVIFVLAMWLLAQVEVQAPDPVTTPAENQVPYETEQYRISADEGNVFVQIPGLDNRIENTNISLETLPEEEQKRIKTGSYFVDEATLYDFLETYTS